MNGNKKWNNLVSFVTFFKFLLPRIRLEGGDKEWVIVVALIISLICIINSFHGMKQYALGRDNSVIIASRLEA